MTAADNSTPPTPLHKTASNLPTPPESEKASERKRRFRRAVSGGVVMPQGQKTKQRGKTKNQHLPYPNPKPRSACTHPPSASPAPPPCSPPTPASPTRASASARPPLACRPGSRRPRARSRPGRFSGCRGVVCDCMSWGQAPGGKVGVETHWRTSMRRGRAAGWSGRMMSHSNFWGDGVVVVDIVLAGRKVGGGDGVLVMMEEEEDGRAGTKVRGRAVVISLRLVMAKTMESQSTVCRKWKVAKSGGTLFSGRRGKTRKMRKKVRRWL